MTVLRRVAKQRKAGPPGAESAVLEKAQCSVLSSLKQFAEAIRGKQAAFSRHQEIAVLYGDKN